MSLSLVLLRGELSVHRLPADAPLPACLTGEPFYALLRSRDELSVCCRSELEMVSERREDGWACLMVAGPLDFGLTGIVAGVTAPLAEAEIPVFVVSSFDTDYLLVKLDTLERACDALRQRGFHVTTE